MENKKALIAFITLCCWILFCVICAFISFYFFWIGANKIYTGLVPVVNVISLAATISFFTLPIIGLINVVFGIYMLFKAEKKIFAAIQILLGAAAISAVILFIVQVIQFAT